MQANRAIKEAFGTTDAAYSSGLRCRTVLANDDPFVRVTDFTSKDVATGNEHTTREPFVVDAVGWFEAVAARAGSDLLPSNKTRTATNTHYVTAVSVGLKEIT